MNAPPYGDRVMPQVARALALVDRNPASATYGCADRAFWHYRTLVDFSGSPWQNVMLGLAALAIDRKSALSSNRDILSASRAALGFWARLQHADGAVDEWYRNEHAFCPTAFTTAAAAQTILLLNEALPADEATVAKAALSRAAEWLSTRFNPEVMNQNLAAALALWGTWRVTDDERFREVATRMYARVAALQNPEGWLPEYGGFDYGYSTLSLDLLAAGDCLGAAEQVIGMAERLIGLLDGVTRGGGGLPGRLGSRGTAHAFTYGAEYFANRFPAAARVASRLRRLQADGIASGPADVDDRYFATFYFSQFALAHVNAKPLVADILAQDAEAIDLPAAGIVSVPHGGWSLTRSRHLGGAFAIERVGRVPLYHLGYELATANGDRYSSAAWHTAVSTNEEFPFSKVSAGQPLVRWSAPFHLFTRLLGIGNAAALFARVVKTAMIRPRGAVPFRLRRNLTLDRDGVSFRDEIIALDGAPALAAIHPTADIAAHSPSARLDKAEAIEIPQWNPVEAAKRLARERRLVIEGRWPGGSASA